MFAFKAFAASVVLLLLCAGRTHNAVGQGKALPGVESLPGFDAFQFAHADVDDLASQLEDEAVQTRRRAALAIGVIGRSGFSATQKAVPALTKALEDKDAEVRKWSIWALSNAGADVDSALPMVKELLFDQATEVRQQAGLFFAERPRDAAKAVKALQKSLRKDKDKLVQAYSAWAVVRVEPNDKAAMEILRKGLNAKDRGVPTAILSAFQELGLSGLPVLAEELRHENADVRSMALSAMYFVMLTNNNKAKFPSFAIQALIASLKHDDKRTVVHAIGVVSYLGEPAKDAIPTIIDFLKAPEPDVRYAAASGLIQFGSDAKVAIPALTEALQDKDEHVQRAAKQTLNKLRPLDAGK